MGAEVDPLSEAFRLSPTSTILRRKFAINLDLALEEGVSNVIHYAWEDDGDLHHARVRSCHAVPPCKS